MAVRKLILTVCGAHARRCCPISPAARNR